MIRVRPLLILALLPALALPAPALAKRKLVQPKSGAQYSGRASNGGYVTLDVKPVYDVGAERVYLYPYITWTRVGASCDIFDGKVFVPTKKRITARFAVSTAPGAVRKGRFDETKVYGGQPQSRFKGTFSRTDVQGTVEKITTQGVDVALGYGCKWGPLTFDLALN